jgi:YggT family protein
VGLVCAFLTVYIVILFARAVFSWFPPGRSDGFLAGLQRVLFDVTEPVLAPVRSIIPPAGMFDLSFLVVTIGLVLFMQILCS